RRCALFSVGDEHAAVSRAASPAPIKVLLSTLVGSCPLPGLLWLAEAWSVIIERVSLECATRSDARAVGRRAELGISDSGWAACSHPSPIYGLSLRCTPPYRRHPPAHGQLPCAAERLKTETGRASASLSRFRDLLPPRHRRA